MEGGGGVPHDEIDRDEETAQDNTERATDDSQQNILLEEHAVPGFSAACMCHISGSFCHSCN